MQFLSKELLASLEGKTDGGDEILGGKPPVILAF